MQVERDPWWWAAWGDRPARRSEGKRLARRALEEAPPPPWLGGGLFMPFEPLASGDPLFWVNWVNPRTGVEVYVVARDLVTLFWHEDGIEAPPGWSVSADREPSMWDRIEDEGAAAQSVPFWSELAAWSVRVWTPDEPTEPEVHRVFRWES